jgi:Uncharacterised protein family (UPF0175)
MASVTVEIPDDLLAKLKNDSGEPDETLRRVAAFFLCSRGELSTSQAARLAGMTYSDFLEAAARAKVVLRSPPVRQIGSTSKCRAMFNCSWLKSQAFWTDVAVGVMCICIIVGTIWLATPREPIAIRKIAIKPGITKENCNKIRLGITMDEVEALMGQPPSPDRLYWIGEFGTVYVKLDVNNRVAKAYFVPNRFDH